MKSGIVYYANDVFGKFSLAIKYEPGDYLSFCKAAMSCGVFATITPVGNVRVFTHRQVSRLLSNKPAVLVISLVGDKLSVQLWKEEHFYEEHSISETLVGVTINNRESNKNKGVSMFYYITKEADNNNVLFSAYSNLSANYKIKDGKIYIHENDGNVINLSKPVPGGTLLFVGVNNKTITFTPLASSLNANLGTVDSTVLLTMFLKMMGTAGPLGDVMKISLANTMFSKDDILKTCLTILMKNMGYEYQVTNKSTAILYPVGYEEDAAVVHKSNILAFQLDKKEMTLSIVDWDEKESEQ